MGQLTNLYVSQSYQGLLKLTDSTTGLTPSLQTVQDGLGGNSPLQISQTEVNISGSFYINNVPITNGTNGTSGTSGVAGSSGTSGTSGVSGSAGTSGTSGTSGQDGSSGTSGTSGGTGSSGTSGTSGGTGSSGTSGTSGQDGSSGTSGTSGVAGSSGTSGTSGVSPSLVGVITTGSITSTQVITGSLILGNTVISGSLIGGTDNGGLIKIQSEANRSGSVQFNITSSLPVSSSNVIFGAIGPATVTLTGSIVISGSNNILFNGFRTDTSVNQGTYGYISSNNILTTIPTLNTGSLIRPAVSNNINYSTLNLNFITASVNSQFTNNINNGGININSQSGSVFYSQNINNGGVTLNQNTNLITGSSGQARQSTISQNTFAGPITINNVSSSINATNNITFGTNTFVTNSFFQTGSNNFTNLQQNIIGGFNNHIQFGGNPSTNLARSFSTNILGGIGNIVNMNATGSDTNMFSSIIYGNNLSVNPQTNISGLGVFGSYNKPITGSTIFVVGNGTGAGDRRNAIEVTTNNETILTGSVLISGSNHQIIGTTTITGSLNVSGAMTLGFNDGTDNITSIGFGAGRILYRNANKYTTAIGEFTGTQNKFADGTNNILLGGFNSQFSTGSQNFLVLPTGGNFKSGSINIIIGNTENITSGSQNILIGQMPSSLGPRVDAHFVVKSQSESNSYLFKSGSGANVPIQIGFPVQVTGSLNVNGNTTITGSLRVSGDVLFASGSDKTMGTFVLDGGNPGVATVSNSLVTATSLIFLTKQTNTNSGNGTVSVTSKGTGTFSVTSNHNGDTDTVAYLIINPA